MSEEAASARALLGEIADKWTTNANLVEDDDRFKLCGWAEFEREGPR